MKILIIDNYDSFTYNLYQYAGEIIERSKIKDQRSKIEVARNDEITVSEIKKRNYDRIILSPGPGDPADKKYFGVCADVIVDLGKTIPVLGVCLGMQGIAHYFGGKVIRAREPMHGKTSRIIHDGKGVFKGLPLEIEVMRYHSLVADPKSLPECLEITAVVSPTSLRGVKRRSNPDGIATLPLVARDDVDEIEIMGLRHKVYPIEGVQFHPESIGTEGGKILLSNFLFQKVHLPGVHSATWEVAG